MTERLKEQALRAVPTFAGDPWQEEAILHFAQTYPADFVAGIEIGQSVHKAMGENADREDLLTETRQRALATPGSIQALLIGSRIAIDESLRPPSAT